MLHAVFVRTLKPGVSYEQFKDAWVPERVNGSYPARASIGRNVTDDRQVITIIEVDAAPEHFAALTRPDALNRIAELVESTQLEGVYEQVLDHTSF
jgi:hypothetical protein